MARSRHKLTDSFAKSSKLKQGRHADGGGLYLSVSGNSKSWVFMWTREGKRREMGLGAYPAISLADARAKVEQYRVIVAQSGDPFAARDRPNEPTFGKCAEDFIAERNDGWKNEKHRDQWRMTLLGPDPDKPAKGDRKAAPDYCQSLRGKLVSKITADDIFAVLNPIWLTKHETASRIRGRLEIILGYAKSHGWRSGENPAAWRDNLDGRLQNPSKDKRLVRGHHAALPYREISAFMAQLRALEGVSPSALEFTILTGARTGEALGAIWDEIDFNTATWTIPAERMKSGIEHRVPLSGRTVEVLQSMNETKTCQFVFPGTKPRRPLSSMALAMVLRRMEKNITVHGFRSCFRDWAAESTSFPREICEQALAHSIGTKVEKSYQRGDYFEKRRKLMVAWASYCEPRRGNVVALEKRRETA